MEKAPEKWPIGGPIFIHSYEGGVLSAMEVKVQP
jgi:hypothetical protein